MSVLEVAEQPLANVQCLAGLVAAFSLPTSPA